MNGVWILLGILKWIGIVLLGLLLLLFVILALVLLSPIRYRLSGQKDADMGGAFDVSYLWGAVRANGTYTPEQALRMKAKVLWFTVLGKEEKAETPPKEEKPKQEKAKASKEPKESRESKEPKETMEPTPLAAAEKTEEERPPKAVELPKAEKPKKTQGKTVRRVQLSEIEERPPTKEEMLTAEEEAFFTGEEAEGEQKKERIPPSVRKVWAIQDKKGIWKALQKLLRRLLKEVLPGNLFVKSTIGTGDPTTTGYVLAAAGLLTAKFGEDIQIKGDFTEKKAEDIEVCINGEIVPGYLLWAVLAFAAAPPVRRAIWYMIKELRKKEN